MDNNIFWNEFAPKVYERQILRKITPQTLIRLSNAISCNNKQDLSQ